MSFHTWFEADKQRVVREVREVKEAYPRFILSIEDECLVWEGELPDVPPGVQAPPLRVRLIYPQGFPIAPIKVFPLSPDLPPELVGHAWHRWSDGSLCMGRPEEWDIRFTAREVIDKAADWYFNYQAMQYGLIDEMPDVGRAQIAPGRGNA